ncbi:GIY-YIG nuclease family protein [Dethiosulfovibrio salsuginis]|uniref:GIY-YIG domain-containing protein n=1 Tax=Dethiosulfovibrio salsuginis TaxID=561720 RepID=A0A1X7IM24_9BACT|nr:hypothetical protein [Dethiosulfovibrio salsuginis]SMG16041.1 hypothetical protein SAMN06275492_10388 [Dethiosulfovibrio salsuginis]
MGLLDEILKICLTITETDSASLKSAYIDKKAPSGPGVYKIFYKGQLMKVGKAEDGLRKRFSDYYRGPAVGTARLKYITSSNRDDVSVFWQKCPASEARKIETMWYDQARKKGEALPWSDRR